MELLMKKITKKGWALMDRRTGELIEYLDGGFVIAKYDEELDAGYDFMSGTNLVEVVSVEIIYKNEKPKRSKTR